MGEEEDEWYGIDPSECEINEFEVCDEEEECDCDGEFPY